MPDIFDPDNIRRNILSDMRVKLSEEFDRNFERKAFFSDKWKKRANPNAKGTLLMVTGTMRRSIKSEVRGNGVLFTSDYKENRSLKKPPEGGCKYERH